ncbi:CAP domain-containing protein [Roseibium sp. RKSG952]|uniref:CAP domain-containing protein n=1 Tax=Roseibium sp. RKSG952 TaxID=2529384 RepID=UPI0012BB6B93|nr:CAP domain-containing protein [Roseibium sp. RKSG952]MTH98105.1 CAP domain-containing protein [Roseibium sp. RKSG952]
MLFTSRTAAPAKTVRASLFALAGLVLSGCVSDPDPTPPLYRDLGRQGVEVNAAAAAGMISQYRMNKGLGPVTVDPSLNAIAERQADAMAKAGTVKASLARDQQLDARLAAIGEPSTQAVENVSAGYRTLAKAFSGWRDSPKHNAVMLDRSATRLGIATAYSPNAKHKVFWSLVMAGPENDGKGAK